MKNIKSTLLIIILNITSCSSFHVTNEEVDVLYSNSVINVISRDENIIRMPEAGYLKKVLQPYTISEENSKEIIRIKYINDRPVLIESFYKAKRYTFKFKKQIGRFSSLKIDYSDTSAKLTMFYNDVQKYFYPPFNELNYIGDKISCLKYKLDKNTRVQSLDVGLNTSILIKKKGRDLFLTCYEKEGIGFPRYITYKWDKHDNFVYMGFTDTKLKHYFDPAYNFSYKKREYDNSGYIIKESYFDEKGEPCYPTNGEFHYFTDIIKTSQLYVSSLEYSYINSKVLGAKVLYKDESLQYTHEGEIIKEKKILTLYGDNKLPIVSVNNLDNKIIEKIYNKEDKLERESVTTGNNLLKKVSHTTAYGSSSISYSYSENGFLTLVSTSDTPVVNIQYDYDIRGNLKETSYRNEAGGLKNKEGYALEKYKYNDMDLVIEESFYDENLMTVEGFQGYHKKVIEYDIIGRSKAEFFLDKFLNLKNMGAYAIMKREWMGNIFRVILYDENKKIIESQYREMYPSEKNYIIDIKNDKLSKKITERIILNSQGQVVEKIFPPSSNNTYSQMKILYNSKNRISKISYYDENENLIPYNGTAVSKKYVYDFLGRTIDVIQYNYNGEVITVK